MGAGNGWSLAVGEPAAAAARAELGQREAWRLFTRGITPEQALADAKLVGDQQLGCRLLDAVAIIA
jgi:hypothetical protein